MSNDREQMTRRSIIDLVDAIDLPADTATRRSADQPAPQPPGPPARDSSQPAPSAQVTAPRHHRWRPAWAAAAAALAMVLAMFAGPL